MADTSVFVFVNDTSETSIALEIASHLPDDIALTCCSFFDPDAPAFGLDIHSLGARSQFDVRAYRRLYALLRADPPDVFHVHPNATGSIARVIARAAGVPHVVSTEHSTHTDFSRLKNLVNGSTNWLNDVVVCNSETTADSLGRWERALLGVSNTSVAVIHNGVDLDSVRDAGRADAPDLPDGFLVGTAARLVPEKNIDGLLTAGRTLVGAHPDAQFIIVGDGPERGPLETRAEELGIAEHVHFLGYRPRREVHAIMQNLDVYAFPSHYEGFGVALAEAMAAGCPVVVADIPVLREVVGDAGVFVAPTDSRALADAFRNLHDDTDHRAELGEQAAERVEDKFSIRKTADRYGKLYRVLATHSPPDPAHWRGR